jgi:hypothetical protein
MRRSLRICAVGLVLATAVALSVPGPASSETAAGCPGQTLVQPFLRWLDPLTYVLVPNGGLEAGVAEWSLTGNARRVSENEPWRVRGAADTSSLALASGSSATTGWMCISLFHPTLRLFAANRGLLLSTLKVEVLYRDAKGSLRAAPIGALAGVGGWQPTLPLPIVVNVTNLPLLTDGTMSVAFRFTPQGLGADWRIDDVYVDPYQGR